jgi:hypothetical protein
MPPSILLDWQAFADAVRNGGPQAVARMQDDFEAKLRELGDADVEAKARAFVRSRGETVPALAEAIATVDTYLNERRKAS